MAPDESSVICPLEFRYGRPAFRALFSREARLKRALEVEAALALSEAELGLVPPDAARAIEEAAKRLGINDAVTVFPAPAERALYRLDGPFDIVYLDPPYADPVPLQLLRLLRERELLSPDALVVYEHAAKRILPEIPGYRSVREEVYGDVALAFLAPQS